MNINRNTIKEIIKKRPAISVGGIVLLALALWAATSLFSSNDAQSNINNYTVRQGPLKISITETGTIQPKEKLIVKNEVEGSTAITYIADERSTVKKGDLMIQLDSSSLSDKKVDQEIQVQKAEATKIEATENYEVTKNQAQSDIESAKLAYDFAQLDLKKYIEGEYPDSVKAAESNITVAEQEVAQAKDTLDWSKKLYEEGYLSQSELEKDTLSYTRKQLAMELKTAAKELLVNYTHKRQLAKLQSDVTQTKSALERSTRKATANVAQAEAKKAAMQAEFERQSAKLEKYKNQLEKTKIYAPADGTIIYATSAEQSQHHHGSRTEPLKVGNSVQERLELIHLPTTSGFVVNLSIPEASIDKVKEGLPAQVTLDNVPNVVYTGKVTSVSNVVDAQSNFMNHDLKVYSTVITLEDSGDSGLLHSGMSCSAEIIIDQYENSVYVPIQAVMNVGGEPTVYMVKSDKLKPRTVETGLDNNMVIRITSGLEPGEIVTLAPPLAQAAIVEQTFEKLSEISLSPLSDPQGDANINLNMDANTPTAPGKNNGASDLPTGANKSQARQDKNTSSDNRYSTSGAISDSSNSPGGPGGGVFDDDDD
jgi:HlyD family secretion protein